MKAGPVGWAGAPFPAGDRRPGRTHEGKSPAVSRRVQKRAPCPFTPFSLLYCFLLLKVKRYWLSRVSMPAATLCNGGGEYEQSWTTVAASQSVKLAILFALPSGTYEKPASNAAI